MLFDKTITYFISVLEDIACLLFNSGKQQQQGRIQNFWKGGSEEGVRFAVFSNIP